MSGFVAAGGSFSRSSEHFRFHWTQLPCSGPQSTHAKQVVPGGPAKPGAIGCG